MKRSAPIAGDTTNASIVELEARLDWLVRNRVHDQAFSQRLVTAQRVWSRAIWTAAESLGPAVPPADELDRGLELTQRPVFLCGAARSGTTLLRDLLDGHPQLVVIPTESLFYTSQERALFGLRPDRHSAYLGCRWLEALALPPPFWLLGSSALDSSPYVTFARAFVGWWRIPDQLAAARIASWPLCAFALAYAQGLGHGRLPPLAQMWVEKTPGSERFLARAWQDFPAAKVIHIVRRPEAVLASIKRMTQSRWSRLRTLKHIAGQMAPAYRIAADNIRGQPASRYCLVRYEDLVANPDQVMRRVAAFLEIEPLPSLLQPTVAGGPAANNTSFGASRPRPDDVLDPIDRALLKLAVGRHGARLGYAPSELSRAPEHLIVGSPAQRQRADALATD